MNKQEEKVVSNNISNYLVLPLLQLNKSSFGIDNFINCFVDKQGFIIVNTKEAPLYDFTKHINYATDYEANDGSLMIVFYIPEEYKNDILLFEKGAYSEFTASAKLRISKYSRLKEDNELIKCLNPSKEDREVLADKLGVKVEDIKELRSAPSEINFMKIK